MHDHSEGLRILNLPPSQERLPLFVVGDVHGCADELARLVKEAHKKVSQFQLVLVGDLFTKGPDPAGVFDIIQEENAICIKGNHDWALLASINHSYRRGLNGLPDHTRQTIQLIRNQKRSIGQFLSQLPHALVSRIVPVAPKANWESSYPIQVVHAGVDPTVGLLETSERMLLTMRYVRWEKRDDGARKLALVPLSYRKESLALNEEKAAGQTSPMLARLPDDRFRWHELHTGPELIVFGHDARQGLFRKTLASGRPICVGLDTGCTYGRSLTGYFPEFDDALQVSARRSYFDVAKNQIILPRSRTRRKGRF